MNNYTIKEVKTSKDAKIFRSVAVDHYKGDPNWVHPLDNDIEVVFDRTKNERFQGGDATRWVLFDGDKAIGRIAAYYNNEDASRELQPTGACGFFECPDDQTLANMLFDTAREWLRERGMEAMDGSVNFGDRMMWWGVLVEGFTQPLYGMNYNYPYYEKLFESYGFCNYFNQHSFLRPLTADIRLADAMYQKAERLYQNPDYRIGNFDKKNPEKMANDIMEIYNSAWAHFEGVKPLNMEHAMQVVKSLVPIIDNDVIFMTYHKDVPVGFFIMIPDINQIIGRFKGKLSLINKLRLLWLIKRTKQITRLNGLMFGVRAEYQGKGLESAMIYKFEQYCDAQRAKGVQRYTNLEHGWVGDFNPVMIRMCESYVMSKKFKRHVTYRYLFDREKPFTRCPRLARK